MKVRPSQPAHPSDEKIKVEPGFEKRLADTVKRALSTPAKHVPDKRTKQAKAK